MNQLDGLEHEQNNHGHGANRFQGVGIPSGRAESSSETGK
jgi:hypothetical protein